MSSFLLLTLLAAATPADAAPASGPPAVAAPATPVNRDIPGLDGLPVKVEKRILVKAGHPFFTGGATFYERGDYYNNPGLSFSAQIYINESIGISARFSYVLSTLNSAATEVFLRSGLVPDSERVISLASIGARYSLGYGKLAMMPVLSHVLHFDIQAIAHFGFTITERAANPTLMAGPSLLVRVTDMIFAHIDTELTIGYENRSAGPVAVGFLPQLFVGVRL